MINRNCMIHETAAMTKAEIIEKMVDLFDAERYLKDRDIFHEDILAREEVFSTYIGFEIGLPHGKSKAVREAGIAVAKLDKPIVWNEENGDSVDLIIMIAVKAGEGNDLHLQVLSKLSRMLMHEDFRDQLKNSNLDKLHTMLTEKLA
ncbi:MAG: PTS sugar transporter subunit IIA [Lachnospiraceae bacterium]